MKEQDEFRKEFLRFSKLNGFNTEAMLTPYIIEERQLNVAQMDVFSRLMMERIIWLSGGVGAETSDIVQAQLMFLDSVEQKDITLHLNTPGGSVVHGLGVVDVMDYIKSDVATVNLGMCASMGSVFLAAGTPGKRSSLRTSKVMTHEVSSGTQGVIKDNRINHIESEKYNFMLFKLLGKYTGKGWKQVMEDSDRDNWLNSTEAKEYGLIDEIITPQKEGIQTIEDLMEGFEDYYFSSNIVKK